jgi:hypothetical protein
MDDDEEIMLMDTLEDEESNVLMTQTEEDKKGGLWFLDSGCSHHMCGVKEKFSSLNLSYSHTVKLVNNSRLNVSGKGNVRMIID